LIGGDRQRSHLAQKFWSKLFDEERRGRVGVWSGERRSKQPRHCLRQVSLADDTELRQHVIETAGCFRGDPFRTRERAAIDDTTIDKKRTELGQPTIELSRR
jgi:hypothetical protein